MNTKPGFKFGAIVFVVGVIIAIISVWIPKDATDPNNPKNWPAEVNAHLGVPDMATDTAEYSQIWLSFLRSSMQEPDAVFAVRETNFLLSMHEESNPYYNQDWSACIAMERERNPAAWEKSVKEAYDNIDKAVRDTGVETPQNKAQLDKVRSDIEAEANPTRTPAATPIPTATPAVEDTVVTPEPTPEPTPEVRRAQPVPVPEVRRAKAVHRVLKYHNDTWFTEPNGQRVHVQSKPYWVEE